MAKLTTTLMVTSALLATAACTKKRPAVLPPAPGETVTGSTTTTDNVIPGSRADFERSVTSNTINFGLDQYDIDPRAREILDSQSQWLSRYPNVAITLEGHADERGTREYNLALGARRAAAAKEFLASQGVPAGRMRTISYGKEKPVAVCDDISCWSQNRRAVTVLGGGGNM